MAKEKLFFDPATESIIASTEFTARYFSVTSQTLSNWVKAGCPQHSYGYYDIRKVTDYRAEQMGLKPATVESDPEQLTLTAQKTMYEGRLKAAQLEAAEFKNALNRGEYLEREKVVNELKSYFIVLKRSLQGLGKTIARDVADHLDKTAARKFEALITVTINDALEQMAIEGVYHAEKS